MYDLFVWQHNSGCGSGTIIQDSNRDNFFFFWYIKFIEIFWFERWACMKCKSIHMSMITEQFIVFLRWIVFIGTYFFLSMPTEAFGLRNTCIYYYVTRVSSSTGWLMRDAKSIDVIRAETSINILTSKWFLHLNDWRNVSMSTGAFESKIKSLELFDKCNMKY